MSFITLKDVVFSYDDIESNPNAPRAVDGVSMSVENGEFVAVIGHNGCGKSTIAKHLNAMLLPDSGKVFVDSDDTSDENKTFDIRKKVGLVLQNPDNQLVASIVGEDVAFGPENLGVEPEEIRKRVDSALKAVGMYEYRMHAPHLLSGGQKQRVAIAGVLAMQPKIIVLDEPTAMLDPQGRHEVISTVNRLCRENGMTVVLITHHMDECIDADRLIVMSDGAVALDGTPVEVFSHVEQMEKEGLSVPETVRMVADLKKLGFRLTYDTLQTEACADAIAAAIGERRAECRS